VFRYDHPTIQGYNVTPRPILGPVVLTPGSSLGSYIVSTYQHEFFVCTLSSLIPSYAPEKTYQSVTHPKIDTSQARLTCRYFRDRLPKKKMHLFNMSTLLILLSLGPEYHNPMNQDITYKPQDEM
jgi:hypothetical protein